MGGGEPATAGSGEGAGAERTNSHVSTVPTASSPTSTQVECARASAKLWSSTRLWNTAPVTASARAPASTRSIASTPEAIPVLSLGIAAIAALDIGA